MEAPSRMFLARTAVSQSLRLGTQALRRPCRLPLLAEIPGVRTYASKKNKKAQDVEEDRPAKKASTTDQLVPASARILAGDVYYKAENSMKAAIEWYRKEVAGMETRANGRVTPSVLSPVRVTLHGANKSSRLEEVATVGVREGTTLVVTVFEEQVGLHLM
jgi:ribosome recycling factor